MLERLKSVIKFPVKEKEKKEDNIFTVIHQIKDAFKSKRKKYILLSSILLLLSIYLAGLVGEMPMLVKNEIDGLYFDPISCFYCFFTGMPSTLIICLVLAGISIYGIIYVKNLMGLKPTKDEDSRVMDVDDGSYGNAHWMDDGEKAKALVMAKRVEDITLDIFGVDNNGYYCARKPVVYSNGNVITLGAPGSGKTTALLNNDIFQCIRRGESYIAIDSKGGIYKDTAYAATRAGYDIKIYNTKPDELKNSDAFNPLLIMDTNDPEDAKAKATSITNLIMSNIGEGERSKKDIWYTSSYNLLRAMILIVKFSEDIPEEEKHLPKVYELLVDHSDLISLVEEYKYVTYDKKHPAYTSLRTFLGEPPQVKVSALGGLITNLTFLDNEYIKAALSHNEIDFEKPGLEKCAYYIVIYDTDTSNNILAPLFIETICIRLTAIADREKKLRLPVKVNLHIDEAKNIGTLPGLSKKLSTYRSRGIDIKLFFQDLSQMMQMFPDEGWREIIADCTTIIVLKIGEQGTAEYIEKMMGTKTVSIKNIAVEEFVGDPIKLHPDYRLQNGTGSRPLMYAAEIRGQGKYGLQSDEIIILIDGEAPLKLKKFQYWNHPMYKALHLENEKHQIRTIEHIPKWRLEYDERLRIEKEKTEFKKMVMSNFDADNESKGEAAFKMVNIGQQRSAEKSSKGGSYGKKKGI